MKYIRNFSTLTLQDTPLVGSKNATLGEFIHHSHTIGDIKVPRGFAVTVQAYWDHILTNNLYSDIQTYIHRLESVSYDFRELENLSYRIRNHIEQAPLVPHLYDEIAASYEMLCKEIGHANALVVVRSSATAEDLPNASFAGQQESYLSISGIEEVISAYKKCIASLFTERALLYRKDKGFDHLAVGMAVGIQQMVRADVGSAGVVFTLEPETGFKDVVVINAAPGLGQALVQGSITPDEYHVFKPFIMHPKKAIIKKMLRNTATTFCLTDDEILQLSKLAVTIESYYQKVIGQPVAVDIEWAQDGITKELCIVQVRPETIHSLADTHSVTQTSYSVVPGIENKVLVVGHSIGQKAVVGVVKCIPNFTHDAVIEENDIIVTAMTDPDWIPLLKKAAGVVTENGGRTCHAAIVSRELGIPAIVGAYGALQKLQTGQLVTLDCTQGTQGFVYEGRCTITHTTVAPTISAVSFPCSVGLIIADPDHAYKHSKLPVDEVGLVRLEFMITHHIKAHPMALLYPEKITDISQREAVIAMSSGYENGADFFVKKLAQGVGTIAAAFYPRPVLVRFSDFKSNEYRNLVGGSYWEPHEENPMLGLRGASRYYHPLYQPAFLLECQAIEYVRTVMGFTNVNVMVPFVRTVHEGMHVKEILTSQGLVSGKDGLQIFMMCELPSNVILLEQFAQVFDGFSIGSNDLTQTVLAVDRDSGPLTRLFKEDDPAVLYMVRRSIIKAHAAGKKIGICGQGPSDNKAFAEFLITCGIDSISLNVDSVIPFIQTNQWIRNVTHTYLHDTK